MPVMPKKGITIFFLLHWALVLNAQKIDSKSFENVDLWPFAEIFIDSSGTKNYQQVKSETFTSKEDRHIANTAKVVWTKFKLENSLDQPFEGKITLYKNWCERATVYSDSESGLQVQKYGMMLPLDSLGLKDEKELLARPDQMTIRLKANEISHFYIRYEKGYRPYLGVDLNLYTLPEAARLQNKDLQNRWVTAAFMAVIAGLSLFNLLYFFILKDSAYLYYSLYGFSAILAGTVMDSYCLFLYDLFYQNNTTLQPYIFLVTGSLSSALYMQFSRVYLHTKVRFPLLDKILIFLILLGAFMAINASVSFYLTGNQHNTIFPFSVFMAMLGILYFVQIGLILRKRVPSDMFLMAGIGLLLICILPNYVLQFLGKSTLDSNPDFIGHFSMFQLGTTLEMMSFALGLGYRTLQLKKDKLHYEELDSLKSKFFANISHEFRTPLMLIKGPLAYLRTKLSNPKEVNMLDLAENNAHKLFRMINEILDLSKLEAQKMELDLKVFDLIPFLKGLFFSFDSLTAEKNISLQFESDLEHLEMAVDKDKMESIFINLISNAIKYTQPGGRILIKISRQKNTAVFNLIDTGMGISKEETAKIFERFYRVNDTQEHETSFGIGLALVKELVQLHKGKILVKSKLNEGSDFEVRLPIKMEGFQKIEVDELPEIPIKTGLLEPEHTSQGESHILLIEDNAELRAFVRMQLGERYRISEAENGTKGIKKAKELQPDLIISDVMMAGKTGYEVTAALKNDIHTSHIPIILLTAKASQKEKFDGLETGADAYLTKPFELSELEVRIANLIKLRKELKIRFSKSIEIKPEEVSVNSIDQEFLKRAVSIIELNMDNEALNVELFAKEIGISTTQLNLKLKTLIGQSTNKFIQSIRLKRAAELLIKEAGSVSEIGFQTGFSSTAYFVSSFKKYFGVSPGSYKNSRS